MGFANDPSTLYSLGRYLNFVLRVPLLKFELKILRKIARRALWGDTDARKRITIRLFDGKLLILLMLKRMTGLRIVCGCVLVCVYVSVYFLRLRLSVMLVGATYTYRTYTRYPLGLTTRGTDMKELRGILRVFSGRRFDCHLGSTRSPRDFWRIDFRLLYGRYLIQQIIVPKFEISEKQIESDIII